MCIYGILCRRAGAVERSSHQLHMIWFAFITGNSSFEPLFEGLFVQIHVNLRCVFSWNQTRDLRITKNFRVPRSQMQIHKPNHVHTTLCTHVTVFAFALAITWAACMVCCFAFTLALVRTSAACIKCCMTYQLNRDSTQMRVYNQITCSILADQASSS